MRVVTPASTTLDCCEYTPFPLIGSSTTFVGARDDRPPGPRRGGGLRTVGGGAGSNPLAGRSRPPFCGAWLAIGARPPAATSAPQLGGVPTSRLGASWLLRTLEGGARRARLQRVDSPEVVQRRRLQPSKRTTAQTFAHPVPVKRDRVSGGEVIDESDALDTTTNNLDAFVTE